MTGINQGALAHFSFPKRPRKENTSEHAKLTRTKLDKEEIFLFIHEIKMKVITVCNKRTPGLDLWEKTARRENLIPVILGLNDSRELGHESQKFGLKFILLAKYLSTLPPGEVCLITDGFDVIFFGCESLKELESMSRTLLFAGDVYENPDQGNPYTSKHLKVSYLNSGVYAGTASLILEVLRPALEKDYNDTLALDDQRYFTQYMFSNPGVIKIDHECKYFACFAGLDYKKDFWADKNGLTVFSQHPCVLHFQGFYKDTRIINDLFLDPEIRMLGKKLLRLPSPWGKPLGDFLVKLGSFVPVDKHYFLHAGICVVLILTFITLLLTGVIRV
jgi:hypothetical protein